MSFDCLLGLYGDKTNVVRRAGRIYPAATERCARSTVGLAVVGEEPLWVDPQLRAAGQAHLDAVAARSPGMHDGRVLGCASFDGLPIRCGIGGYFDTIATSDSLRAELLENVLRGRRQLDLSVLPRRRLAHAACGGDPMHSGRGRVAAIGVSVAVTGAADGGRALVLGLRSSQVATDPGMWHIAPSGTLEPAGAGADAVLAVVERELHEELGVRIERGSTLGERVRLLGIGFDLLRLRPEICLRLDLRGGEMAEDGPTLDAGEFQQRGALELTAAGLDAFWQSHPPHLLTPAAAAAIVLLEDSEGGIRP